MTEPYPLARWLIGIPMILAAVMALVLAPFSLEVTFAYMILGALTGLVLALKEQLLSIVAIAIAFVGQELITNHVEEVNPQIPPLIWEPLCLTFGTMVGSLFVASFLHRRYLKGASNSPSA